ncbi:MAG TPA: hypothetical protein PKY50_19170 [Candidatus Competibacter sp.]|nr:hypothetical protein [Candidatus Competibacter sp.]
MKKKLFSSTMVYTNFIVLIYLTCYPLIAYTRWLVSCDILPEKNQTNISSCFPIESDFIIDDPEISPDYNWITWQSSPLMNQDGTVQEHGAIYVAPIDQKTGNIIFPETQAFPTAHPGPLFYDGRPLGNGPEFALSQRGTEIFFKSFTEDEKTMEIRRIFQEDEKKWKFTTVPNSRRNSFSGSSTNLNDIYPLILWKKLSGSFQTHLEAISKGIRIDSDNPSNISLVKGISKTRWVPNPTGPTSELLLLREITENGVHVASLNIYNIISQKYEDIPTNGQPVKHIWAWAAPELDGEIVLLATIKEPERDIVNLYRRNQEKNWEIWNTIESIDDFFPYVDSPEVFVFGNHSFVFMVWMDTEDRDQNQTRSIITLATADPNMASSEISHRIVSKEFTLNGSFKHDPEVYLYDDKRKARIIYMDFQ